MALMKCPECGKEISDKATSCPNCGAPVSNQNNTGIPVSSTETAKPVKEKKKGSCLKSILIVIAVFFVLIIIVGSCGSDNKTDSNKESNTTKTNTASNDEVSEDSENNTKEVDNKFVVGETADVGDVIISFLSAEQYVSDNMFIQPKDGNIYYRMGFEVENIGEADVYVSSWDWKCYADGYAAEQTYFDDESIDATLSPGKKTKGYIFFEVPEGANEITLEYETNFWTEEKIIFVVK